MAYGSAYKDSPYAKTAQAVSQAGARQRARDKSPRAERENRMAQLMRMASYAAPAIGTGLGAVGGGLLGAGIGAATGGVGAPAVLGGIGAGASAGGALGGAISAGLQGMSNETQMRQQEEASSEIPPELMMALLGRM